MNNLIFKQYNYMLTVDPSEFYIPPYDYNYNIYGLYKKRFFNKGELYKTEYYGYVDSGGTYQDLVLTEYREYFRKDMYVFKRRLDINWYLEDGTTGATKTTYKYYPLDESIKLGEQRRRNIISELKITTVGLIQMVSGLTEIEASEKGLLFLNEVALELTKYIEGIEDPLKEIILTHHDDTCTWLDGEIPNTGGITIREYLYDAINIDYSDKLE